jgi:hypothetical protein
MASKGLHPRSGRCRIRLGRGGRPMIGTFWAGARAGLSFAPGFFVLSASFGAVAWSLRS